MTKLMIKLAVAAAVAFGPLAAIASNGAAAFPLDPKKVKCALACKPRAGFAACLARCVATSEVCDGGLNNCRPL